MITTTGTPRPGDGLIEALHVPGPGGEHPGKLMLFGRFVGSWNLQWTGGSPPATATGELHVGWVLAGWAVQDIWIVPGRGQPGEDQPPLAFHGTTIRFYDPSIDAWRSTWIEPVNGRVRRFIGRPDGEDMPCSPSLKACDTTAIMPTPSNASTGLSSSDPPGTRPGSA